MNDSGLSFNDFWQILRRRKWVLVCSTLLFSVAAVVLAKSVPLRYSSEALLVVEAQSPMAKELQPGLVPTTADQVQTEVDILRSRSLAEAVVRELGLTPAPPFTSEPRAPNWYDRVMLAIQAAQTYMQSVTGADTRTDSVADAVADFQRMLTVVGTDKSHV